jgi:hypothetical protein
MLGAHLPWTGARVPDADPQLEPSALPAREAQRRRNRWLLLGAAVVLSALIGGGTTALLVRPTPPVLTAASPAPSPATAASPEAVPPAPAEPEAAEPEAAEPEAPTEPSPAASPPPPTAEVVPGVVELSGDAASFRTPTGNIGCQLTAAAAACDVLERTWELPPRPADCDADFGQGAFVDGDRSGLTCASDTPFDPDAEVLDYGTGWALGQVRCLSARDGVTCEHTGTGHGFAVSRDAYRLF